MRIPIVNETTKLRNTANRAECPKLVRDIFNFKATVFINFKMTGKRESLKKSPIACYFLNEG